MSGDSVTDTMVAPALWLEATLVDVLAMEAGMREIVLDVGDWPGHLAGQHVDVRLPGGGRWDRPHSYSIANAHRSAMDSPTRVHLVVSAELVSGLGPGMSLQIHGPKGERMAWTPEQTGDRPLLLIAGGTGIIPLIAIANTWATQPGGAPLHVICSVRSPRQRLRVDNMALLAEEDGAKVTWVVTGSGSPARASGSSGRITARDLEFFGLPPADEPECFVCGSPSFVESVAGLLAEAGHPAARIRTEWEIPLMGAVA
ncbi:ferredoxin--NADP reductase [Humibacter soli]